MPEVCPGRSDGGLKMKKHLIALEIMACLISGLAYFTYKIEAWSAVSSLAQVGNTMSINDASVNDFCID
jgi:hypothetical protein